jgi:HlyD family secretion protein
MRKVNLILFSICLMINLVSCKHKETVEEESVSAEEVTTPVTVTTISTQPLSEYVELNATSAYLQNSFIKATANGYIKSANLTLGQYVAAGQLVFTMKTKEAQALGNTINVLDSSFNFSGLIKINASEQGFVSQLNHQPGDYVQDGEQLAMISNSKSFAFILNLPYELRPYLMNNKGLEIHLPDGMVLNGTVTSVMPTVDSVSQTQSVVIRVNSPSPLPQNLIAKVRIIKGSKNNAPSLPKEAVLTDEAQSNFWVMKMIDSTTAVKVPVIKGMETADRVEIIRPVFALSDKILLSGNYGLPDTAKVKIMEQ